MPKKIKSVMPPIGLGTWKLQGEECERAIRLALDLGYRHIDTADMYQNHREIGRAIKTHAREDLYLVSKVGFHDLLPEKLHEAVSRFLKELQTDYLDLLLIHWPNPAVSLMDTLQAMQNLKNQGKIKEIGVSNFVRSHLEQIASTPFSIFTNQIELHPYFQRKALTAACQKMGITITAYRPLAKGIFEKDPTLQKIGSSHGKSASQIALRWLTQQGFAAIPKTTNPKHLKENLDIFNFSLSQNEMQEIERLNQNQRFCAPADMPIVED